MGCDSYNAQRYVGGHWGDCSVSLNYDHDEFPCVCTFHGDGQLDARRVRSLAAIGAAVVLAHHGDLTDEYIYTPSDLPDRVTAAIRYFIPVGEGE